MQLFTEELRLRTPAGLQAALTLAATRRHMSRGEFVRQALLRSLELEGLLLLPDGKVEERPVEELPPWAE